MAADSTVLNSIPDEKPVRIFLPIKDNKERYRLQCVYQVSEPPRFNLLFQPGSLPVEMIDLDEPCIIIIDMGGPTISIEAKISEVVNKQTLAMILLKSIPHEQMREFFRVDATAHVISRSFQPEVFGDQGDPWSTQGRTIDISGSGILASFPAQPPMDEQVRLEITLPTSPPETIKVLSHPVRMLQVSENQWDVAYHFDDITDEDRDKIIGCCLVIQRRLLRLKVKVRDQVKL
ncbi:MAG: hypothetical protein D6B25_08730 [Desulfobulbaceae bacterium]|nr:MAG: hypothetical protein D6B25_08730 [Desulfobulbaceae bacterium]